MATEMNEMKLTAFALGELYGPERAAVEAHVARDPDARRFVDEMRETARVVTDELAHEPVVGLLAVHHAAIERQLEEADHLRPMRIHRAPAQPLGARVRQWAAFGLTAAAAVLIVGGALAVLAPQLYDPNGALRAAKGPSRGPIYFPGYGTNAAGDGSVAPAGGAPDPFTRPEAVAVDDQGYRSAPLDPGVGAASGVARNTRPGTGEDPDTRVPFGAPATDAAPRVKRPGDAATPPSDALARGGAERPADYAAVRAARSDDDRSIRATYLPIFENPFVFVAESPLSAFAVNVDPASYFTVRRTLNAGKQKVAPVDVRVEELLNYFNYDYKQPPPDSPDVFAASIEVTDCPWENQHRLVRIGLRGKDVPSAADKKAAAGGVVFLVDVSASMADGDKLGVLKGALRSLAETMTPADRFAIVTYGGAAGGGTLALAPTGGNARQKVLDAIDALTAGGAPAAGDAGIALAYEQAATKGFVRGGVNRVVICTDRDFYDGAADQLRLNALVDARAKSNVQLSVVAIGAAQLNAPDTRRLARLGGGTYAYADTPAEAKLAVAAAAAPAPAVIAKDVRVQVEFNPLIAGAYRLIGYENGSAGADDASADRRFLAGRSVTALYEVVPKGKAVPGAEVFALKYSTKASPGFVAPSVNAPPSDELLTLKLHYVPADDKAARAEDRNGKFQEFPAKDAKTAKFAKATRDFKFAAAVAEFALILRGSEHRAAARFDRVLQLATEGAEGDQTGRRREFVELVRKAQQGPQG